MDNRLKKNTTAGRESRGADSDRSNPADAMVSAEERRRMFRSEWFQEALPTLPEIPGFHTCWLSTTNQYDPIHKRLRMGYTPVMASDLPDGYDHLKIKSGEQEGFIAVNEMLAYKIPLEVYQDIMREMHHDAPMDEQTKIKVQQEQLLNAKDSNGKRLGQIEGDGMDFDLSRQAPLFE
jgi:hypothetical protein